MKILAVDDDPSTLIFFAEIVRTLGFEFKSAENGVVGWRIFQEFKPEIVITDIDMPEMNGLDLLEKIRSVDQESIVIIVSGLGHEKLTLRALRLRANDYFIKPVRSTEIIQTLRKYSCVIADRTLQQETLGMIVRRTLLMQCDNRIHLVPKIADLLIKETGNSLIPQRRLGVRLGLVELITNAIEHGNLEISYQEKSKILARGFSELTKVYEERANSKLYADRRVTISFSLEPTYCSWLISDEGHGFDWNAIPDPLSDENLLAEHGRGIFLARMQFDEMEFLDGGRTVFCKIFTGTHSKK